jgi:NAD(P)-dependent dehydrogenase (short-subunit alcohol dehydrogenase family)
MSNTNVYRASKAAVLSLVRMLSGELIGEGFASTRLVLVLFSKLGLSESDLRTVSAGIRSQVPAGRFGHPSEIAKAVVFLASDESAFTVGGELLIDGGLSL